MDFGEVLSKAWQIIWKHKVLWIFGILAGCANSGNGSSGSRVTSNTELPPHVQNFFDHLGGPQAVMIIIAIFLVILVLVALFTFLGTIGRIGLIRGAMQADQEEIKPTFGELFSGSMPYFWRIFLMNLVVGLVLVAATIFVVLSYVAGSILTLGIGFICLIPFLCLLAPVFWAVSLLLEQANIAIVIEDLGITAGIQRGWEIIKANAGVILVMWLILGLGVGLVGGLIIGLPFSWIAIPVVIGVLNGSEAAFMGGFWTAMICLIGYLPFAIVLNGILFSYTQTSWTLTFLRLTKHEAKTVEPAPELEE